MISLRAFQTPAIAAAFFAFGLLFCATAGWSQIPAEAQSRTNSIKLPSLPELDGAKIGPARVSPSAAGVDTDVGSDLPLPLGPASVASGGSQSENGEWVIAPIPFRNASFGWGIGLGAGYIYQPLQDQTNAPPWVSGIGAFYTENGTWGVGGAHKMNLDGDRWRISGGGGYADLYYDFYGVGSDAGNAGRSVALNQRVGGGRAEILRQVSDNWYAGLRYTFGNSRTRLENTNLPPGVQLAPDDLSANVGALGVHVQRDTRDSQFYPRAGSLLNLSVDLFENAFGSDFTFQAYELSYNHYLNLASNHVVALRGYGRATSGRVPFFALCSFGTKGDLRGYTPGRYRDKMMFATQAEYRWRITQRFGLVAFAGIGGVAPELDEFETVLPSGGVGARYVIAKKNNVSLRLDAAWGRDERVIYFGVGEAF